MISQLPICATAGDARNEAVMAKDLRVEDGMVVVSEIDVKAGTDDDCWNCRMNFMRKCWQVRGEDVTLDTLSIDRAKAQALLEYFWHHMQCMNVVNNGDFLLHFTHQ